MIGRGTRLCQRLLDGNDKDKFYIVDFCGNFEFFRMGNGKPTANRMALQGAIFNLEFQIAYKLQDIDYQTERFIAYRDKLVQTMSGKVAELNREKLMYGIELAYLADKKYTRARSNLMKRVSAIASIANIPEIQMKSELIRQILNTSYVEDVGINEFEHIREELRDLMKYIPQTARTKYVTDFTDLFCEPDC